MPVNLVAGEKMNIRPAVGKLAIPLGAALHKEGSSLGAIIKIAVLFAILDQPFSGAETLMLALFVALLTSVVEGGIPNGRSEEHTSELQSLMRNSYAVFC